MGKGQEGEAEVACRDLLADERCSPAVHVGRAAPPVEESWDSDEKEEERAVAAAGVVNVEEEEEELAG